MGPMIDIVNCLRSDSFEELEGRGGTLLHTARRPMSLDPAYEGMCSATEAAELGGGWGVGLVRMSCHEGP